MTVSSVYEPVQYTGNGVTTAFAFPYIFYYDTDIIVTLTLISTGANTLQVNPTDYTITGGDGASGTINFVAAPSALYRVTIERYIPYLQEDNYVEGQAFPAQTIETAFDKGVMRDQQINSALERTIKYPATDPNSLNGELPSAIERANKVLSFDADGEPTVTSTDSDNVIAAEAAAAAAEAAQAAAEAAAAMLPLNNYTATAPPTVNDDSADGFSVGSRWVDTTGDLEAWTCASAAVGAAQWLPTTLTVDDLGSLAVLNEVAYANIASAAIADSAAIVARTASKLIAADILNTAYPNMIIQTSYTEYTTITSYSSVILRDNSIPQISEGTQLFSVSFTPKKTTNRVRIRFSAPVYGDASAGSLLSALFINGASNAVLARAAWNHSTNTPQINSWEYEYAPGSVSAQTIAVRVGPNAGTMAVNGQTGGGSDFGAVQKATLIIEEITA